MRLARKLTVALMAGVLFVVTAYGYYDVAQERRELRDSVFAELSSIARATTAAVVRLERSAGRAEAERLLADAAPVQIRWVSLDAPAGDSRAASAPRSRIGALEAGAQRALAEAHRLLVYRGFQEASGRLAAIEVSQSLEEVERTLRAAILRTCGLAAMILFFGALY